MKISLINPTNSKLFDEQKETLLSASSPPLGLLYLATYLRNSGHKISILDQAAIFSLLIVYVKFLISTRFQNIIQSSIFQFLEGPVLRLLR